MDYAIVRIQQVVVSIAMLDTTLTQLSSHLCDNRKRVPACIAILVQITTVTMCSVHTHRCTKFFLLRGVVPTDFELQDLLHQIILF